MIKMSDFHFFCYISNIYYFLVFSMFNIKIYDKDFNFKTTLSERSVSSDFSFSATVWSWVSTLKFDYYWDYVIKHRDIVKIFRDWKLIYQWFVIWINRISDKSWDKETITLSWMLWLLAFTPWPDWTYSNDPWVLIWNIFLTVSWLFNTDTIQNYYTSLSLQSSGNTCLEFLKEMLKNTSDYWLFVSPNNEIIFSPYEKEHILTYWKEVYWIEIIESSSEYYNKFRVNYNWWNIMAQNNEDIEKYWESYLVVTDTNIKNYQTAQARINSLFQEYAIKKTIKVKVNSSFDYYDIKPWEVVTIRNTKWIIQNKPVKQAQYLKDSALLTLDSYSSLESFIGLNV